MEAYIYRGDIYCDTCATDHMQGIDDGDSETYPQGPYPHGGGEADYPQHCADCHIFLENPLTDHGREYVRHKIAANEGNPTILQLWKDFYA